MRLENVFGVISHGLSTYVARQEIDECFKRTFVQKRQLVIYGSSRQGKTTLLNAHLKPEEKILVQCSPTTSLHDIYKMILKNLEITIRSSISIENEDIYKTRFAFKVKIPMLAEAGMDVERSTGRLEARSDLQIDVDGAQDMAEIIRRHFPEKKIIIENFHYLEEKMQRLFAFDLRTFQDMDVRVIILGIWREGNRLTQYNGDVQDRIVELPVEPWTQEHLQQIIELGERSLNIDMSGIKDDLIRESSGNVGMLQELCKESCYDARAFEAGDLKKKITKINLQNAIAKITNSYAGRFHRALETFADAKPRQSQDGSQGLGMPYFFVRVILSDFDASQIRNGVSVHDLRNAIKKIHQNQDNKQFDRALTVFLNRIGADQKNHGITPSIFDHDTNLRRLSIIDPNFFFFVRHYDHQEFLEGLKLPLGFTKDVPENR